MTLTSSNNAASNGTIPEGAAALAAAPSGQASGGLRALGVVRWFAVKLGNALIVLWGAATAVFLAQASLPGDRATVILNIRAGQAIIRTPAELAQINEQYGLQHPLVIQYLDYLRGLLSGSLGNSYQQYRPVTAIIADQIGPTVALSLTAIALSWLIMVFWVTLTAGRSPRVSAFGSVVDTTTAGLPQYWLGIILLLVFAVGFHWFPVISGNSAIGLLLPALTLAIPLAGFMGQATRAEFERSLEQPFVISARMRGMGDLGVRLRHVLRHSVLPAVTLSGWGLGVTLSGAVIVESVFSRSGLGQVLVSAVNAQDMPVVTGIVMLVAVIYVLANILVDLIYLLIDPRLKAS